MKIIDEMDKIKKIDSLDMLGVEERFINQLVEAKTIAENTAIEGISIAGKTGIAILGMGGSGFTGDIIKSLIIDDINIPVEVIKGYDLPEFINKSWLIFAVSYSGNTEETLSCLKQALDMECDIVCTCSGGILLDIAQKKNLTLIKVPSGFQPRGALGYLFFATFLVMKRMGIVKVKDEDINEAMDLIREKTKIYNRNVPTESNPAKVLAAELFGRLPIVYGVDGYLSAIIYRWKCQINENAKSPCFYAEFPELDHNEIVGWQNLPDIIQNFILISFKDNTYKEKMQARVSTTVDLIRDYFDGYIEIEVEGKSVLARALSTIFLGGMASVYLALLYETDPTPVKRIESLKAELAKVDKN